MLLPHIISKNNLATSFENPIKNGKRIQWIDALRGFSIFFVVYYHIEAIGIGLPADNNVLSNILLSFRMPTFFFISGFIAYKSLIHWDKILYLNRIKNKSRIQLIPTLFFFCLAGLFGGYNPLLYLSEYGLGGFWFTFVLFEFFFVYFTLSYLLRLYGSKCFNSIILLLTAFSIFILVFLGVKVIFFGAF